MRHMKSNPAYRKAYDALGSEFALVDALIQARTRAHLSQAEVASRMGTTESAVSRLESGRVKPSTRTAAHDRPSSGTRSMATTS